MRRTEEFARAISSAMAKDVGTAGDAGARRRDARASVPALAARRKPNGEAALGARVRFIENALHSAHPSVVGLLLAKCEGGNTSAEVINQLS